MTGDTSLSRILRVLECFSEDDYSLTAVEISTRAKIPLSTLHRMLSAMLKEGVIAKVPGNRYVVGAKLWELGELSPLSLILRENAIPHLMRLYEATGENVHLAVLDGLTPATSFALFVGRVTGKKSIPTVSRAGGRDPLHATGVGKALLAGQDDAWLEEFLATTLLAETTKTITDSTVLRADLELTRKRGYAFTKEEMTLGNISVATKLPSLRGLPPAAVGVVAHLDTVDEQRLAKIVQQTARDIALTIRELR